MGSYVLTSGNFPASSTLNDVPTFADTTGKVLKDSGVILRLLTNNLILGKTTGNSITTGDTNVVIGAGLPGNAISTGGNNLFVGYSAGESTTIGDDNMFFGATAGRANQTGQRNTYIGSNAGYNATSSNNIFIGYQAGYNVAGTGINTAIGGSSLNACTTGTE